MINRIESSSNSTVKQVRKLKEKKERQARKRYLIEGSNICRDFFESCPHLADQIFVTEEFLHGNPEFVPEGQDLFVVPNHVFQSLCDTKTPQGILIVAKMEDSGLPNRDDGFFVYLDHVADPGNVGTIIRTADAAGVDGVILSPECADLYCPKTVRSTMGSMFHLRLMREHAYLEELIHLKNQEYQIVTGSLDGVITPYQADFRGKVVICLGNEAHGVTKQLIDIGVTKVKIPIIGRAESLNVSTAAAIFMYEVVRQRGHWV